MSNEAVVGAYQRMKMLLEEGTFPGVLAPVVLEAQRLVDGILEAITKEGTNEDSGVGSVESSGRMGNDPVRNRGRKNSKRKTK